MRLTVEEAAKDYAIGKTFFRKNVLKEVDADDYVLRKDNCREDFKAGAEWQAFRCDTAAAIVFSDSFEGGKIICCTIFL